MINTLITNVYDVRFYALVYAETELEGVITTENLSITPDFISFLTDMIKDAIKSVYADADSEDIIVSIQEINFVKEKEIELSKEEAVEFNNKYSSFLMEQNLKKAVKEIRNKEEKK